jgi:hypothetical protein
MGRVVMCGIVSGGDRSASDNAFATRDHKGITRDTHLDGPWQAGSYSIQVAIRMKKWLL